MRPLTVMLIGGLFVQTTRIVRDENKLHATLITTSRWQIRTPNAAQLGTWQNRLVVTALLNSIYST